MVSKCSSRIINAVVLRQNGDLNSLLKVNVNLQYDMRSLVVGKSAEKTKSLSLSFYFIIGPTFT